MEREAMRRSNAPVVIGTLLSLLVVAAAVAAVAYLVLRTPSEAVDSAQRLDPVGTALPAPTEAQSLPTPIPTSPPQPTALGFSGEQPLATAMPTALPAVASTPAAVAQVRDAGPTPTPRLISLPTQQPPTVPQPAATLPPSVPVTSVPVVALQPVDPGPPPTAAAARSDRQPTPTAAPVQTDDPLNVLGRNNNTPRIVPAGSDAQARARAIQDQVNGGGQQRAANNSSAPIVVMPTIIVPTPPVVPTIVSGRGGSVEIVMPDVNSMIAQITAQATDPSRNPNVSNAGQADNSGSQTSGSNADAKKRNNRNDRPTPTVIPIARRGANPDVPVVQPSDSGNQGGSQDCPFNNLPPDQRPHNWPFDNC